jgi:hypothetical protein
VCFTPVNRSSLAATAPRSTTCATGVQSRQWRRRKAKRSLKRSSVAAASQRETNRQRTSDPTACRHPYPAHSVQLANIHCLAHAPALSVRGRFPFDKAADTWSPIGCCGSAGPARSASGRLCAVQRCRAPFCRNLHRSGRMRLQGASSHPPLPQAEHGCAAPGNPSSAEVLARAFTLYAQRRLAPAQPIPARAASFAPVASPVRRR